MSRTRDLTVGLAELLDAEGVGTWNEAGMFGPSDTAITVMATPPSPDRLVTLTPYTVASEVRGHRVQGMQVRFRGAPGEPLAAEDLADAVYQVLNGRERLDLGGVQVHLVYQQSHSPNGIDGDHRAESLSNYYLLIDAPTPYTR